MRTAPRGYESTDAWKRFEAWADEESLYDYDTPEHRRFPDSSDWERFWPAFRDGFSAGLLLHQTEDSL